MSHSRPAPGPVRALLLGTLAVGVLDGSFAIIRAATRGVSAERVLQSIAAGLLGRPAYEGGTLTALIGAGLHFFIAGVVVVTYFLASRRLTVLTARPILAGAVYGVGVFVVMNFVVIPLSAISMGPRSLAQMVPGILFHVFGVGLPAALAARAVPRRS